MTELNAPSDVTFVLRKAHDIGDWFREHTGGEAHHRYESVPRNFLRLRSDKWIDETPTMVRTELDLGTYRDKKRRLRPDLIFEYERNLWIIEVKHHYCRAEDIFENPMMYSIWSDFCLQIL